MPQPELKPAARKYLFDVAEACDLLQQFTHGKHLADYIADALLRSAVERQFGIIGEALNQALRVSPELGGQITDTRRIVAFRHRLIHGYTSVSSEVVWGVMETSLSRLRREVRSLLDSPSDPPAA